MFYVAIQVFRKGTDLSGKYEIFKECEVDLLRMGCIYFLFNICYLESFVCIISEVGYLYGWEVYY
jgi:hypothetical protein